MITLVDLVIKQIYRSLNIKFIHIKISSIDKEELTLTIKHGKFIKQIK